MPKKALFTVSSSGWRSGQFVAIGFASTTMVTRRVVVLVIGGDVSALAAHAAAVPFDDPRQQPLAFFSLRSFRFIFVDHLGQCDGVPGGVCAVAVINAAGRVCAGVISGLSPARDASHFVAMWISRRARRNNHAIPFSSVYSLAAFRSTTSTAGASLVFFRVTSLRLPL